MRSFFGWTTLCPGQAKKLAKCGWVWGCIVAGGSSGGFGRGSMRSDIRLTHISLFQSIGQ